MLCSFSHPTKKENMQRFIDGLHFGIRIGIAREAKKEINLHRAVEIARRLESICMRGRDDCEAKKPCSTEGFSSASSGGRGHYGRGHHTRLVKLELQISHDTPI